MKTLYKQCKLTRENTYTVSWIPAEFAVVGKRLRLRENGVWQDGWVVESAFGEAQTPPDNHKIKMPSLERKTLATRR